MILTQISGGQAPDIFNGGGGWLLEFQSASTLAALGDLLPADLARQVLGIGYQSHDSWWHALWYALLP